MPNSTFSFSLIAPKYVMNLGKQGGTNFLFWDFED